MRTNVLPQFGLLEHRAYTRERIKEIVYALRACSGQVGELRFDPYLCATSLGLIVREVELPKGISGQLRLDLPHRTIEIEHTDGRLRQRYTVCHEIAHLCFLKETPALPRERGEIRQIPDVQRREERLCDMIAAELLMPETAFLRHAKAVSPPSLNALTSLSGIFDVSLSAVLLRLRYLRVWSLGITDWQLDVSHGIPKRGYGWTSVCRSVRDIQERLCILSQIDRALKISGHFLRTNPGRACSSTSLKFRDFNVYFVRINSGTKIRAIAVKQS